MLSHLRVSESSGTNVFDDHNWALYSELTLEPAVFAETIVVLIVSEAATSDGYTNFSGIKLATIKFEELEKVDMEHDIGLMFFVLLLKEVNNHVDEHE